VPGVCLPAQSCAALEAQLVGSQAQVHALQTELEQQAAEAEAGELESGKEIIRLEAELRAAHASTAASQREHQDIQVCCHPCTHRMQAGARIVWEHVT
jgi:hypothetical protein